MPIRFNNAGVRFSLGRRKELKRFLEKELSRSFKKIELDYIFCDDEFLLNVNRRFLKHDYYTDIITFPLTSTKQLLEAEIYISVERVKENALKLDEKVEEELLRVIFHGALHLMGYKDKTKANKRKMTRGEDKWLNKYRLNN